MKQIAYHIESEIDQTWFSVKNIQNQFYLSLYKITLKFK